MPLSWLLSLSMDAMVPTHHSKISCGSTIKKRSVASVWKIGRKCVGRIGRSVSYPPTFFFLLHDGRVLLTGKDRTFIPGQIEIQSVHGKVYMENLYYVERIYIFYSKTFFFVFVVLEHSTSRFSDHQFSHSTNCTGTLSSDIFDYLEA